MNSISMKVRLPVLHALTLERFSLFEKLECVLQHKLALVAAPPGYGKTTVVAQFAHRVEASVAWHTIEEAERDLASLVAHFLEVIADLVPDAEITSPAARLSPKESATYLTTQLQKLITSDVIYVFDDIHLLIASPDVEVWLQAFLMTLPPKCHIILMGRALPKLPTMEMIAHGEVLALGQSELAFTFPELQALAERKGLSIPALEIQRIVSQFEGWPAGSILAIQPLPREIEAMLFEGRRGPEALFDTLAEMLLHAQSGALQGFLLAASTLSRMTSTLCEIVLQLPDSRELLIDCLEQNVFITQIHRAFVFHSLFRDFLQRHLKLIDPLHFAELHCRAAEWFETNHHLDTAFDHFIEADHKREAAAIAERAASAYQSQGKSETVLSWRSRLTGMETDIPNLLYTCATIHQSHYRYTLAEADLTQARQAFQQIGHETGVTKVDLAQAFIHNLRGNPRHAADIAETVLKQVHLQSNLRGNALLIVGNAYRSLGTMEIALQHLEQALPLYRATGDAYAIAHVLLALNTTLMPLGRFEEASAFLQEAIGIFRALGNTLDLLAALNNLGYDYHLLGEYERAFTTLDEGLKLAVHGLSQREESYLLWSMGDLQRDRGAFSDAIVLYRKVLHGIGANEPALRCGDLLSFATLRRWEGKLDEALSLANEAFVLAENHKFPFEQRKAQVCVWAVRAQQGETKEAQHQLAKLADNFAEQKMHTRWAQTLALSAHAALLQGDTLAAHHYLKASMSGVNHEITLQPCVAEIFHTPLLKMFVETHGSKYPILLKGIICLASAQVEGTPHEIAITSSASRYTYSLRLWALGQERAERDGIPVPLSAWRSADARQLFFYLLLKGASTREQLGLLLWPDSSAEQVRQKFHITLHRARNALGTNAIQFEDDFYFVNPDIDLWCDAVEFGTLVHEARLMSPLRAHTEDIWRRAAALYQGELLSDFDASWIIPHRELLQQMHLESLISLGNCLRARGNIHEALREFELAQELDPYREDIHRLILTCYAALGERSSIYRHMELFTLRLETDLGVTPSTETLILAKTLLA